MALIKISEPDTKQESKKGDEVVIGIDLGTTNSLVAIVEKVPGTFVRFFTDENGCDIHPSIVTYGDKKIASIKRFMNVGSVKIEGIRVVPAEASSKILKHLKNLAEKQLKTEIKKAVVTVPAYFDEVAKNATKLAANLAGLEVLRLVNEPTAAALAYGLDNAAEGTYCIYDLGGGTFDVSILKMQKGVFKVLGVSGDNALGGDDFDEAIAKKLAVSCAEARQIKEKLSFESVTKWTSQQVRGDRLGVRGNSLEVLDDGLEALGNSLEVRGNGLEALGNSLGTVDNTVAQIPNLLPHTPNLSPRTGCGVHTDFTREEFEKLIAKKIGKTFSLTKNLIDDLDLESTDIKGVILVGGSSRIPLVKKKLAEIFGEEKILDEVDPDRIVAAGAAWQAYNLSGNSDNLLLDVVPLSLGIEIMGGIVDKVILRNSTIPTALTKEFTTYADNQNGMKLHIVQGERELASDCRSLAHFEIKKIPTMKAGLARVAVTFKIDADGLLTVTAEEKLTGEKQEILVKPSYGLSEDEVKKMLLDSLKNSKADMANRLLIQTITEANHDIMILEKDLEKYVGTDKKLIIEKINNLEKLITEKSSQEAILAAKEELGKAAENLILEKVNAVLDRKIVGKKITTLP